MDRSGSHRHREPRRARPHASLTALVLVAAAFAACGGPPPTASSSSSGPIATSSTTTIGTPRASTPATGSPSPSPSPSPSFPPVAEILPVPTSSFGPAPSFGELDAATEAALERALDDARTKAKLPGIAAAVVFPDGRTWTGASGYADIATRQPMTPDTLISVGSITKTFVASLVLRLADRGTLRLDDPLSRYVPSFPNASRITLRMLLSHTSGIQDLFQAPGVGDALLADPARSWTPAEVLARIGKPYFAPGTGYHYSNTNYLLLGVVVEKVTGRPIASLIRNEFLAPLGLGETFYQGEESIRGTVAQGYLGPATAPRNITAGQRMLPFVSEVTAAGASGAMASSVSDVAKWAAALYGGGIIDSADLASMTDVSPSAPYKPRFPYGLGFEECTLAGHAAWGHRGHLDGYWASMAYLPAERLTVVVFTNADWADPLTPSGELVAAAIGAAATATTPTRASPAAPSVSPRPSASTSTTH